MHDTEPDWRDDHDFAVEAINDLCTKISTVQMMRLASYTRRPDLTELIAEYVNTLITQVEVMSHSIVLCRLAELGQLSVGDYETKRETLQFRFAEACNRVDEIREVLDLGLFSAVPVGQT